ncbi:MAG: hypothetical protein HY433_02240 [Candidatus Liptonbacteria bacterium]|nr:hypothetical protein [Parcubacteria group bacterium]MBI4086040.1 hypothetical protein [Candidatus Liptonbacteria bacterium]
MISKKLVRIVTVLVILGTLIISGYIWYEAVWWDNRVESGDGWYQYPELSRLEIMLRYQIAFGEIILLNGLVLTLIFLLPKAGKIS